jgi:hypothetical protein
MRFDWSKGLLFACLFGIIVGAAACGGNAPTVGNFTGTCPAGTSCSCNVVGNCEYDCPGGGCTFTCGASGNCLFSCAGGGCNINCQNTGNCNTTCPGNGCHMTCTGAVICSLENCPTPSTCTKTCNNSGSCT